MIALYAKVYESKTKALATRNQCSAHLQEDLVLPQRRQTLPHAQRDVQRMVPAMCGALQMSDTPSCSLSLSTRSRACTAPRAELKCALPRRTRPPLLHL